MSDLADSIKRCLDDCARLEQFEAGKVIIQLVELVEEMRESANQYADAEYAYTRDYHGIEEFESLAYWQPYLDLRATLTKADALLSGLKK